MLVFSWSFSLEIEKAIQGKTYNNEKFLSKNVKTCLKLTIKQYCNDNSKESTTKSF